MEVEESESEQIILHECGRPKKMQLKNNQTSSSGSPIPLPWMAKCVSLSGRHGES